MIRCAQEALQERGNPFTAQHAKVGNNYGTLLNFANPQLTGEQRANLHMHGLPVEMEQEEGSTKMFVSDRQILEHFQEQLGDMVYVMTAAEVGTEVLKLSQQEGRVENGR